MSDIQTISVVLAGIGIFVAAINSIISNRKADQQRQTEIETRQAELFMELYQEWRSPPMQTAMNKLRLSSWEDYDDFMQKYGARGPDGSETRLQEMVNTFIRQAAFYEGIGVLVEKELIDIDLVDRLMHNTIKEWWERTGPLIREARKRDRSVERGYDPDWDSAEWLYHNIMAIRQRQKAQGSP